MRERVGRAARHETGLVRFVALLALLCWGVLSIFDQSSDADKKRAIASDLDGDALYDGEIANSDGSTKSR